MYDDFDFLMAVCLRDGSAGEDGDASHGGGVDHVVEDAAADQACSAGEYEMHFMLEIGA